MAVFPLTRPVFGPAIRQITAITPLYVQNTLFLTVTTSVKHYYKDGLFVRLSIPPEYAAQQLDQLFSEIFINDPTSFTMTLPSFVFDPFVVPGSPIQVPLSIPIAEDVLQLNEAERNLLPNG